MSKASEPGDEWADFVTETEAAAEAVVVDAGRKPPAGVSKPHDAPDWFTRGLAAVERRGGRSPTPAEADRAAVLYRELVGLSHGEASFRLRAALRAFTDRCGYASVTVRWQDTDGRVPEWWEVMASLEGV